MFNHIFMQLISWKKILITAYEVNTVNYIVLVFASNNFTFISSETVYLQSWEGVKNMGGA